MEHLNTTVDTDALLVLKRRYMDEEHAATLRREANIALERFLREKFRRFLLCTPYRGFF